MRGNPSNQSLTVLRSQSNIEIQGQWQSPNVRAEGSQRQSLSQFQKQSKDQVTSFQESGVPRGRTTFQEHWSFRTMFPSRLGRMTHKSKFIWYVVTHHGLPKSFWFCWQTDLSTLFGPASHLYRGQSDVLGGENKLCIKSEAAPKQVAS